MSEFKRIVEIMNEKRTDFQKYEALHIYGNSIGLSGKALPTNRAVDLINQYQPEKQELFVDALKRGHLQGLKNYRKKILEQHRTPKRSLEITR